MRRVISLSWNAVIDLFGTLLPDFVLAFTFFTALIYSVLGHRLGRQRPAAAVSGALGVALAIGLVWWESERGWSVRDLGPIAVGFAVILLGMVMYQAIRQTGGSWAGAAIALGASILVGWILGFDWFVGEEIIQTVIISALVVGVLAFLLHMHTGGRASLGRSLSSLATAEAADIRHDMSDLYQDREVGSRIRRGLRRARREAGQLDKHPEVAGGVMRQLSRMLPAEGWLTKRVAKLREKAYRVRKGHIARIEELRAAMSTLSADAKKRVSQELAARYADMKLDSRIDRLDSAVAANERKIRDLTSAARAALAQHDHRKLTDLLKAAEKLQKHNSTLLKAVERTEKTLAELSQGVARGAVEVNAK